MTASRLEVLRTIALDTSGDEAERTSAIRELAESKTGEAKATLLQLASRPAEPWAVLRAAGVSLAWMLGSGVEVSEWDLRDLTDAAAEAFFE